MVDEKTDQIHVLTLKMLQIQPDLKSSRSL